MKMKKTAIVLICGLFVNLSGQANAQESRIPFPIFDVDAKCSILSSPISIKSCVQGEQRYYDYLKVAWDNFLPETKLECSNLFKQYPGNLKIQAYKEWVNCLHQFGARDRLNRQGKFQP